MLKIKRLAAINAVLVLLLVGLGGFVRGTGAGLSCPDWPLCFGRVIPHTLAGGVAQEYFHRVLAGVISLLTIGLAVLCFRAKAEFPRLPRVGVLLLVLLLIQAILGGLTVLLTLNPYIVTGHLIVGTAFFQCTALLALERAAPRSYPEPPSRMFLASLSLLIVLLAAQISLGGFVGSSGASLACPDFPLCSGEFPPASAGPQWTVFIHGMLGFSITAIAALSFYLAIRGRGAERYRRGHMGGMVFLLVVQVLVGIGNIHMQIAVSMAVVHLLIAQLILLGIASLYKDLRRDQYFFRNDVPTSFSTTAGSQRAGLSSAA